MLKPHEIFLRMPRATAEELFTFLLEKEKPLYRATIDSLAKQRKLRPVFVERKPRKERHVWMQEILGKKNSDGIAAHLLQIWLVGAHSKLLCDFLDGLGIKHDENGTVDALPSAPPKAELARKSSVRPATSPSLFPTPITAKSLVQSASPIRPAPKKNISWFPSIRNRRTVLFPSPFALWM